MTQGARACLKVIWFQLRARKWDWKTHRRNSSDMDESEIVMDNNQSEVEGIASNTIAFNCDIDGKSDVDGTKRDQSPEGA